MTRLLEGERVLLEYDRLLCSASVTSLMVLPPYKGGVLHSAFGRALRRECCREGGRKCTLCNTADECLYGRLFEPLPPRHFREAAKYRRPPPPLVLNPPTSFQQIFKPGTIFDFELILIGFARQYLPFLLYVLETVGRNGLGRKRGRFRLLDVDLQTTNGSAQVYEGITKVYRPISLEDSLWLDSGADRHRSVLELNLVTPLRLKQNGHLVRTLSFALFLERIVHRLQLLVDLYGSNRPLPDVDRLLQEARQIGMVSQDLCWHDWRRYSRRQDTFMRLGGMRGRVRFIGPFARFAPYVQIGEHLNLGQASSFGLGKFRAKFAAVA